MSSPLTIEFVKDLNFIGTRLCFVYRSSNDNKTNLGVGLRGMRNNNNNSINISLGRHTAGDKSLNGDFTLTFTVTKIEQYY